MKRRGIKKPHILILLITLAVLLSGCGAKQEAEPMKASLTFESFDGGGPEFTAVLGSGIVSYESRVNYSKPDHEEMTGAGYTVTYTFTGIEPGETELKIEERSPIADNLDHYYSVKVDEKLNVTIEHLRTEDPAEAETASLRPRPMLVISANGGDIYAYFDDSEAAVELLGMLEESPIEVSLSDYGGFEKVGPLPRALPASDENITTEPGDIMLYQGRNICVYYGTNTWDFTRLAKITDTSREELLGILGEGGVEAELRLEWVE